VRVRRREAWGESKAAAGKLRWLLGVTISLVAVIALGASGCGGSDDRDLESFLEWQPGDYRTLPASFCEQFEQDAGSLIPSKKGAVGGSHPHQATCDWSTIGDRFRTVSFRVTLNQPDPIDHIPAEGVASQGYNQFVGFNRKGLPFEDVRDVRAVPGLGDQATVTYGVAQHDHAVAQIVIRQSNVVATITVQGSDTTYRTASDGSGVIGDTTPLSQPVLENVATEAGKHVLAVLPPQPS
jgi:hypothetical protein